MNPKLGGFVVTKIPILGKRNKTIYSINMVKKTDPDSVLYWDYEEESEEDEELEIAILYHPYLLPLLHTFPLSFDFLKRKKPSISRRQYAILLS